MPTIRLDIPANKWVEFTEKKGLISNTMMEVVHFTEQTSLPSSDTPFHILELREKINFELNAGEKLYFSVPFGSSAAVVITY